MQMPSVSMNPMAMNESVATTCCFRKVPTASLMYWEVLHGGWIGNGFVEQAKWHDGLSSDAAWIRNIGLDLALADGKTWDDVSGEAEKYEVITVGGVKRVMVKLNAHVIDSSVQSAALIALGVGGGDPFVSVTQDCNHTDYSTCKMKYLDQYYAADQHFEATSSHDVKAGQKWNAAHDARQYSS